MGKDQFRLVGSDAYLVVFELFALFEQRTDYVERLDIFLDNVESRLQDAKPAPEIGYERYEAFTRATRRITGNLSGLELAYQIDLVSAGDGVGYLLLSWTGASSAQALRDAVDEVVESFRLPGEGSEWFEKSRPSAHRYGFGEWVVELSFPDSVFSYSAVDSQPQERYTLSADEGGIAVHLFVDELSGDADAVLDEIRGIVSAEEPYDELLRSDLEGERGDGRQLLLRSRGEPPHELAIAVVELERGRWIDLRMVTSDSVGHREQIWGQLLSSLRAEREDPADAFPVVEPAADAAASPSLTDSARRLLEGSRFLVAVPWTRTVEVRPGGDLVVQKDGRVLHVPTGEEPEAKGFTALYASGERLTGSVAVWGQETVFIDGKKEVHWIVEGRLHPAGFRADRVASAGEELLLARSAEAKKLLGLGELPVVGASRIVLRRRSGEERLVLELPDRKVEALAFDDGQALVGAALRDAPRGETSPEVELLLLDTRGGTSRPLGRWGRVERIAAGPGGWLVSGTVPDGDSGVFLLHDDGSRELLISGGQQGLALDEQGLTYVVDKCLGGAEDGAGHCVYRAPLALVREHGPGFWPYSVRRLNEIATAAFDRVDGGGASRSLPATREGLVAFLAAADAVARERIGSPLPVSPEMVDLLLGTLVYDWELTDDAVVLLAVLVTETFLQQGAVWVPAAVPEPLRPTRRGWEAESTVAVGIHPLGVVRSTLFDEEGWYRPRDEITEQARGRALLLGPDPASLRAQVRATDLTELPDLLRDGMVEPLVRILAERRQNLYLRDHVYRQLAAHGHDESLARVAETFAAAEDAAAVDRIAMTAVRLTRPLAPGDIEGLLALLRATIEQSPEEGALYLLLGSVYEQAALPERVRYARACYRKAQAVASWGPVAEAAQEALERIDEAP
jgi:hypothetical protein